MGQVVTSQEYPVRRKLGITATKIPRTTSWAWRNLKHAATYSRCTLHGSVPFHLWSGFLPQSPTPSPALHYFLKSSTKSTWKWEKVCISRMYFLVARVYAACVAIADCRCCWPLFKYTAFMIFRDYLMTCYEWHAGKSVVVAYTTVLYEGR